MLRSSHYFFHSSLRSKSTTSFICNRHFEFGFMRQVIATRLHKHSSLFWADFCVKESNLDTWFTDGPSLESKFKIFASLHFQIFRREKKPFFLVSQLFFETSIHFKRKFSSFFLEMGFIFGFAYLLFKSVGFIQSVREVEMKGFYYFTFYNRN